MKNNSFSIIALAISVISLLVSGYIICSENRFNADWYAIVIGVLSLLVTVLIGWNIYTFIDINNKSKELERLIIESSMNNERSLAISEDAASGIYHYLLLNKDPLGLEYQFLYHRIASLMHTSNIGEIETCNVIVKALLEMLIEPEKVFMIRSCKERLILLLTSVRQTNKIQGYSSLVEKISLISVK